jgi:hypothetical protein
MLGLIAKWHFFPFIDDGSFTYFLVHFYELSPVTLAMIAIGGINCRTVWRGGQV